MRKTVAVFIVLFALLLGYIAWPLVSLFSVLSAAQAGDTTTIEQRVNFPALRRSLSVQIVQTYARLTGAQTDRAGIAVGAAASFVDPFIEKLLTPAALADLLRGRQPRAVIADGSAGEGLDLGALSSAWWLYWNSDYGIGEVRILLPTDQPREKQFRVELALNDWIWRLTGLGLPLDLQERLAREMMKQQGKTG